MRTVRLAVVAGLAMALCGGQRVALDQQPRVFIAPMEGQLDGFIAAEIIKKHLPMRVVTEEKDAQLILVGTSLKGEEDKWYRLAKDRNEGNVRLLDVGSKTMVWAGEAGDRSLFYTSWKRGGLRKVAERIAGRMKKEYCESQKTGDNQKVASAADGKSADGKVKDFLFNNGKHY